MSKEAAVPDVDDVPAPILVVDDREDSLRALCAVLEPLGQPVLTARSGDEALRHLLREQVAVILLDVNMPGLDGFSTAALIKRRERTRDIPIIFLTADRDASERGQVQLGYSSGAVDFLVKPFDPWALVSKVTVFVELHRRAEQLRRQVDELRTSREALRNAQRIARLAHFRIDVGNGLVEWSDSAAQLFGIDTANGDGQHAVFPLWEDFVSPEPARDTDHLQTGLTHPDGRTLTVIAHVEFGRDRTGQVRTISGTLQDITEHDETRQALAATTDLLRREHHSVTLLQEAILPAVLPEAPGLDMAARYLPAEVGVGGDWYDASLQPDGRVLLAIGDVAGHGLGAATTMNEIRIASRAFSLNESSPGRILQKLHDFSQRVGRRDLVTALIVLLDPVTGEATVASAGHLPPVVAGTDEVEFVELPVAPPLGTSVWRAREASFVLEPGARLVLYTDGLVEQRRIRIDDRLAMLAEVVRGGSETADGLVDELVRRMLPAGPPSDDVAVLVVQRTLDRTLCIRVPAQSASLAPIRAMMRRWLAANGASTEELNDVVLATGELVSNVCIHAHPMVEGVVTVEAVMQDGSVVITVSDEGAWRAPQERGGGRGLAIVRAVVDDVKIDTGDRGTKVQVVRRLAANAVTPNGAG